MVGAILRYLHHPQPPSILAARNGQLTIQYTERGEGQNASEATHHNHWLTKVKPQAINQNPSLKLTVT